MLCLETGIQDVDLGQQLLLLDVAVLLRISEEQFIVGLLVGQLGFELLHLLHRLLGLRVLLVELGLLLAHLVRQEQDDPMLLLVGLLQLLDLLILLGVVRLDVRHDLLHRVVHMCIIAEVN